MQRLCPTLVLGSERAAGLKVWLLPPAREQEEQWGSGDMDELGRKGHESSVMNAKTPPKVNETVKTSRVISV